MNRFLGDLKPALRSMRRAPAASAAVIATVAVGIAAGATVFSVVDALLLRPLPDVARQSELVNVHVTEPDGSSFHSISLPSYRDLRDGNPALAGLAAFSSRLVGVATGSDEPRLAAAVAVSGNYFDLLGAHASLGRLLGAGDDATPEQHAVAVVSHSFWQERLGAEQAAIGRNIAVNGRPFTVVGVSTPGFTGTFLGQPADLYVPLAMATVVAPNVRAEDREYVWLEMVGRRKAGVTLPAARSAFAVMAQRFQREHPTIHRGLGFQLRPTSGFEDSLRAGALGVFAVLGALAGLVLLVACINVTGILLARGASRGREMAVRAALGGARWDLLRPLLAENLLLFLTGGLVGIFLTVWTAPLLERFDLPTPIPLRFDFGPGPRVFAFGLGLSALAGLAFGLLAALFSTRRAAHFALRSSAEAPSASRLRSFFVAAQVAGCALLLVAAGLFLRTVRHAAAVDPGFEPDGLTLTTVDLSLLGYDEERGRVFYDRLVERAAALPGVEAATITGLVPLGPGNRTTSVRHPGADEERESLSVDTSDVGEGYFHTFRVPILRGRAFSPEDRPGAPPVAIANETLARRLWPGREPIGQRLVQRDEVTTIVGIARDGKYRSLGEEARPFLYVPARQLYRARRQLVLRGGGSPEALSAALRAEIRTLEPALPLAAVHRVRHWIGFSLLPQRVLGSVAAVLGGVGLALAGIGLAGLVAYSVSRRARELGVRMALGARPGDVLRLEMRRGLLVAGVGLAVGAPAALLFARLLRTMLFGIAPNDPATFGAVALLLASISAAATYLPARRAARLDPAAVLRGE